MQTLILLILAAHIATSDEGPIEFATEAFAKIPQLSMPAKPAKPETLPVVVAPESLPADEKVVSNTAAVQH